MCWILGLGLCASLIAYLGHNNNNNDRCCERGYDDNYNYNQNYNGYPI